MPLLSIHDLQAPAAKDDIQKLTSLTNTYVMHLATATDDHVRLPGIHASEISKCYRQAVYTMRAEPKQYTEEGAPEKAKFKKILDLGSHIHTMVQEHFHAMAKRSSGLIYFQDEVKLAPHLQKEAARWNIHSSCDGVFTFYEKDPATWKKTPVRRLGLEIKSMKGSIFESLKKPLAEHVEQVHVYMKVLDLPVFWLLYFDKNSQSTTACAPPWLVEFNPALWDKLEERFAAWHVHVQNNTLPAPMPGRHCTFCPYTTSCKPKNRALPKPRAFRRP